MGLTNKGALGGELLPFFKPDEHTADQAIIFEPFAKRTEVGKYKRDAVECRLTIFRSLDSIEQGKPSSVVKETINGPAPIVKELWEKFEDDPKVAVIARVAPYNPKNGGKPTFVLREPNDEIYDAVAAYYEQRDAAHKAIKASAPSFDD